VPAVSGSFDGAKALTMNIKFSDLVAAGSSWTAVDQAPQAAIIKRGSKITRVTLSVKTSFAGASFTGFHVGSWGVATRQYPITPAADTASGFVVGTAEGVVANLVAGALINGNGSLVALTSNVGVAAGTTSDSDVTPSFVWLGAAPTAGEAELRIDYVEPNTTTIEA
jgi:hypothetical protein